MPDPTSTSLLICEAVLQEADGGTTAVRILDIIRCGRLSQAVRFFALTYLHSEPSDLQDHALKVQMIEYKANGESIIVADAPEAPFRYGRNILKTGPGAFMMTTTFNLELTPLGSLGTYFIQALVDGKRVAEVPLTLLRV